MDDQKGIFRWNDFSDFGDYFVKKVRGVRHDGVSADGHSGDDVHRTGSHPRTELRA
jgi:hypothetical protein